MTDYAVQFTLESRNRKLGAMPVSITADQTCPDNCALKKLGCYARGWPMGQLWKALSSTTAGQAFTFGGNVIVSLTWKAFCAMVTALEDGTIWRHNQAGDLPGKNDAIDAKALATLAKANHRKRGFTYSHKPVLFGPHATANAKAIRAANDAGFTINLSADNLEQADQLVASNVAPVVVLLPSTVQGNVKIETPAGNRVVVCPATYIEEVSCKSCQLCQRQERRCIVGFPAHGVSKRKVSAIASQQA